MDAERWLNAGRDNDGSGLPRGRLSAIFRTMVQLILRPEIEAQVREQLANGVDANVLMEAALDALAERDALRAAIDIGWQQADAGDFVEASVESVLRRANQAR